MASELLGRSIREGRLSRKHWIGIAGWILLVPSDAAGQRPASEWRLVYAREAERGPSSHAGAPLEPKKTTDEILIGLGDTYFYVTEGKARTVYDLLAKRVLHLDLTEKRCESLSLYADLGFRTSEFQNRLGLSEFFESSGVQFERERMKPVDLETLFSIEMPGSPPSRVEHTEEAGVHRFTAEGRTLTTCTYASAEVPDPFLGTFAKYLAHECHLHPKVRREIAGSRKTPQSLEFSWRDPPETGRVRLELKKASKGERIVPEIPKGFERAPGGPLDEVLQGIERKPPAVPPMGREDFVRLANESLEKGNRLQALLGLLEFAMQTGAEGEVASDLKKAIEQARDDATARAYMEALSADPARGIQALDSISRGGLARSHLLDVAKANHLVSLGRTAEAEELFLKALRANPYLAAAYNDLGQAYFAGFDAASAWKCWDAARRLAPGHASLRSVTDFERRLEKDLPDFF